MDDAEQLDQLILRTRTLPHRAAAWEVHEFFRTLPDEAALALVHRTPERANRPDQIARLDGAPPHLRYRASELLLLDAKRRLAAPASVGRASRTQRRRLDTIDEMLRPATGTREGPDGKRIVVSEPRQFLTVETAGQGRMVEVLGDLPNAKNVVVLIPGLYNDLERVRSQMDRAMHLREAVGFEDTAVLVWKDYIAPMELEEAMSSQFADDALEQLSAFEAGLDVVRSPDSHTTFIGNSYGSHVFGRALMHAAADPESQRGVSPDFAGIIGCPGVDRSVTTAAQITPAGTQLRVCRADWDYVAYAQQLGHDPADFADVIRFRADNDKVDIRGHMTYFTLGSEAFVNLARLGRGELDKMTLAEPTTPEQESKVLGLVSWAGPMRRLANSPVAVSLAKAFDGIAWAKNTSMPPKNKALDVDRRRGDGAGPSRPEGPAR